VGGWVWCLLPSLAPLCSHPGGVALSRFTATIDDANFWLVAPQALSCVFVSDVWKGTKFLFGKQGADRLSCRCTCAGLC